MRGLLPIFFHDPGAPPGLAVETLLPVPTIQFLTGVQLFGETLSHGQFASFALIWFGLILLAGESFMNARRSRLAII